MRDGRAGRDAAVVVVVADGVVGVRVQVVWAACDARGVNFAHGDCFVAMEACAVVVAADGDGAAGVAAAAAVAAT